MTISIYTLWLIVILFYCFIGTWKLFEKAGRKSWEGLIPIYNIFIWLKIINKPWWWGLLLLIPGWSQLLIFAAINVSMGRIFNRFSAKDTLMQILIPFVYFPLLAYDKEATYFGETNWEDKTQVKNRKISDQIALFFATFGIFNVLLGLFRLTGSKDKPGQKTMVKEWGDSIVFALIAASIIRGYMIEAFTIPTPSMEKELLVGDFLFVNKFAYGSRVPLTPISFPLAHNTIPFTYINSYSTLIKLPYYRLPGFGKVKRNEIVVFNYPAGDTTVFGRIPGEKGAGGELQGHNYYQMLYEEARYIAQEEKKDNLYFLKNRDYYVAKARNRILNENRKYIINSETRQLFISNLSGYSYRPIDKRENYIKRCVAIPGDTLEIVNGELRINGKYNNVGENVNFTYNVLLTRIPTANEKLMFKDRYGLNLNQYSDIIVLSNNEIIMNMSERVKNNFIADLEKGVYGNMRLLNDSSIVKRIREKSNDINQIVTSYISIYPNHPNYNWTVDNYGPLWMPKEGVTIPLTEDNWIKYSRCINTYENNNFAWENEGVIDEKGNKLTEYTFKQNYYYMIGDNRHNSADSRMWGFVPEDHVVGKGLVVWMSKDQEKGWFDGGVRWSRFFKTF